MLPKRMSESTVARAALGEAAVQGEIQLQVLHGAAHGADGGHAAEGQQVEGGAAEDARPSSAAAAASAAGPRGGSFTSRMAGRAITIMRMPRVRRAPRQPSDWMRPWASSGTSMPPDPDAEIGEAHGLAAAGVEPARDHHLVGERPPTHVAEGVQEIEEVEGGERRSRPTAPRGRGPPPGCRRS